MNKIMSRFALSGILLLVIFSVALTSGCAKDKPCKAVVTVLDPSGNPLSGADVHLKEKRGMQQQYSKCCREPGGR